MKSSIRSLPQILAICLVFLLTPRVGAVRPLPPEPLPSITPAPVDEPTPPPQTDVLTTATIYFGDTTQVSVQSVNGWFQLVGLRLNEAVNVVLQFPVGWDGTAVALQRLDGGIVSAQPAQTTIASDGTASFQFQVGNQPGLYRISITGARQTSILSFGAIDPANLKAKPPVANASH